jgi:hypothetical protein
MRNSYLSQNIVGLIVFVLAVAGCGLLPGQNAESNLETANANAENTSPKPEKTPEFTGEVTFPFEGFPAVPTTAKTANMSSCRCSNGLLTRWKREATR